MPDMAWYEPEGMMGKGLDAASLYAFTFEIQQKFA